MNMLNEECENGFKICELVMLSNDKTWLKANI